MGHKDYVALESTVIAHGLPWPQNLETARRLEQVVREAGAEPKTIGIIAGQVRIGLTDAELEHLARAREVRKVSRRDLPLVIAQKQDGATTVAATMYLAARASIQVLATGGIGGVHRGQLFDVSADIEELAQTPICVVCAGAKAILDLPLTLEILETRGVPVIGFRTDEFPAFYSRSSGLPVDQRVDTPEEVAAIFRAQRQLGLPGGMLVVVPVPAEAEVPRERVEPAIEQALGEAEARGVRGKSLTPFLLTRVAELTRGEALRANLALLENNAGIAAQIAVALGRL
ncbi:MAG: pseudouridine-5'-phosphate glycosidase [Anaerolineae bacterium]|nr:pseudouridine-5'-phosphate glycosidase [Anaerolineae bacterium]MDW8099915.1 pseudouridine-5'-phosphate glycosidase [Anaerolineae bacterium]